MNNQQAINLLKDLEQCLDDYCELNDEGKTAFGMAITALELFGNSEQLPSAQPEQIARDIATIIENEKDMRVILQNEHTETHSCDCERTGTHDSRREWYMKGYRDAQPKWTSVAEALPRDDEDVIVTCLDDSGDTPYSYTTVAWHYKGMWVCDNMRCPFVIAWLPMPDPWKGGQE